MAYTVVRTDNLAGIVDGSKLVSCRFYDGSDKEADLENGSVVVINSLIANTRGADGHVWKAVAPTDNDTPASTNYKLVLVASPEIVYESDYAGLDDFTNKAGTNCLGYILRSGDTYSVTAEAFATSNIPDLTSDKYIIAKAAGKYAKANAATNAFAELIAIENEGGYTYYVIRVL